MSNETKNDIGERIRKLMLEEIQLLLSLHQEEILIRVMEKIKEQDAGVTE